MRKSNKNIAFLVTTSSWQNFQKWHYITAKALYARGYNVLVITNRGSRLYSKMKQNGIEVIPFRKQNVFISDVICLKKLISKNRVETLFVSYPGDVVLAGFAKRFSALQKLYFRRGTVSRIKNGIFHRYVFRKYVNGIITNSMANKEKMRAEKKNTLKDTDIKVVYQGLEIENYRDKIISTMNGKNNKLRIGISNCNGYSHYCREIIDVIRNQLDSEKYVFVLYDSSKQKDIYNQLKRMNIGNLIVKNFNGESFKDFIQSVDVFLSSAASNSFNYSLVHAMAYRKPVIGINRGSNTEIIENWTNGFLLEEDSLSSLGNVLEMMRNRENIEKMGYEAERTVREKFNFEFSIDQIENII